MKTIDVYQQYFEADCEWGGVKRRAVDLRLTAESDAGQICYSLSVSFFPHADPEDFGISWDAALQEVIYQGKGRRSKKREQGYMDHMREDFDRMAAELKGTIYWDKPLIEARLG